MSKRKTFSRGQAVEFRRARYDEWEPGVYLRNPTDNTMHIVLAYGVTFTVPTRRIRAKDSK